MTLQSQLHDDVARLATDAGKLHDIVHGPAAGDGSTVTTDGGPVRTIAKTVADLDAEYRVAGNGLLSETVVAKTAAETAATAATAAKVAAEASATAAAVSALALHATSTTELTIGPGVAVFTTQAGKQFVPGQFVVAIDAGEPTNWMSGQVVSYVADTLTVDVAVTGGAGTIAAWTLTVSGPRGTQGAQGPQGVPGPNGPGTGDMLAANNLDDVDNAAQALANLGGQPLAGELTALAGLASAADKVPYFTGPGAAALATVTGAARVLLAAVDAVAQRAAMGLGTAATLDVGVGADQIVQRDAAGHYPAGDGSAIGNVNAADNAARDQIAALYLGAIKDSSMVSGAMLGGVADAFATDTIGAASTGETYDSGGKYYHNPVPTSGNILTGGTVSASAAALPASNAADGNTGTTWETVASSTNEWWKYDLGAGNAAAASSLRLYSLDARLNAFTLSASNDDASWTPILSDAYTSDNAWQAFPVADVNAYRYWKLDITGIPGNDVIVKEIELLARTLAPDMTLLSGAATATAAPTDARMFVLYKDDSGAAVLNTDVTFEVGRDGGTTWTAVTMVDAGDYDGTYRKLIGHADISGQPSGTSMKWRITTLNNKAQRVRGVAHMWG